MATRKLRRDMTPAQRDIYDNWVKTGRSVAGQKQYWRDLYVFVRHHDEYQKPDGRYDYGAARKDREFKIVHARLARDFKTMGTDLTTLSGRKLAAAERRLAAIDRDPDGPLAQDMEYIGYRHAGDYWPPGDTPTIEEK